MENVVVKRPNPSFPVVLQREMSRSEGRNHSQGSWESSWGAGARGPAGTWNARGLPNSWSRGWSQFPFSSLLQAPVPEPPNLYISGVTNSPRNLLPFYTEIPFFKPSKGEKSIPGCVLVSCALPWSGQKEFCRRTEFTTRKGVKSRCLGGQGWVISPKFWEKQLKPHP